MRRRQRLIGLTALLGLSAGACTPIPLRAEDLAQVWRGKTVSILVGTSAGGGYDTYARMLGRYLGKHLPGNPSVVVTNMPGAASNTMAGYVATVAPKDGTVIGAPFSTQPLAPVLEDPGQLRYDATKLNYIGSANEDAFLCVVRKDAPVKTFADVFKTEVVMGGTAETGSTGYLPILLNNVLGTKFKVVFGYPGSREMTMAMEKGEVHGQCGMGWSSMLTQYANLMKEDRVTLLVQERIKGHPDMDKLGVPRSGDFAKTDEQRQILQIIYAQETFGRPYFVAPEVPKERVEALRKAFMETWKDPELLAEAEKMKLEIGPIDGEELQRQLAAIYSSPPELLRKAREATKLKR
jgi:tripartite-type tricarboxylate transporter receptor subunit TctC